MRKERHLHDLETVAAQQLRKRRFVVPARVPAIDAWTPADPVDEVRDGERVRRGEHEAAAGHEMAVRGVEETTRARKVLDDLTGPHDLEGAAKMQGLRVGRDDVVAPLSGTRRESLVDLDADHLARDRGNRGVHPVGPIDPGAGADVEHGPALEVSAHAVEAFGVASRAPVLGLERVPRRHRGERRRRIVGMAALVLVAAACSGSGRSARAPAPTTTPLSTGAPTSTSRPAASTTTTTPAPPKITSKVVTDAGGAVLGHLTAVDGAGPATVTMPASVGTPAIAHAQYTGNGAFAVSSVNARGDHLSVLAESLGSYDGTFPVGFLDEPANPTAALRVVATGPWHLDIAEAKLAPKLTGSGVSGRGDAVLAYDTGPKVRAHVIYPGTGAFSISTYAHGLVSMLERTVGPYDGYVTLPAAPAFISVTAAGDWSMSLG